MRCVVGIHKHADAREFRHHRLQKFKMLRAEIDRNGRKPGRVPAGSRQASNQTAADWIDCRSYHDGDYLGRPLSRLRGGRSVDHDDLDAHSDEFDRELGEASVVSIPVAPLDDQIPSFDVP